MSEQGRIAGYAEALLAVARAEGDPERIEDELLRFSQALAGNETLRSSLADSSLPIERRQQVVEDLLGGRASPATAALVSMVVAAGRAGDFGAIVDSMLEQGAASRGHAVAHVRSAVELSADQQQRLAAALKSSTGKDVEIRVTVDPTVVGGLVTQIGDDIIDGSVRRRLNQLRESFR